MRLLGIVAILTFAFAAPARAQPSPESPPDIARIATLYVAAEQAVMERNAGAPEVEALLRFYTDDYVYHHPQVGARVTGRDTIRRGTSSHLGETADAHIEIKNMLVQGNVVVLALEEHARLVDGNRPFVRQRIMVLTFRGDRIVQRIDS